jgi:hydrogenase maturation factor
MGQDYENELDPIASAASALAASCDYTTGCITCGDVAVALTVLRLDDERGLALCVDDDGSSETVEIDLVAPVAPGDRLLVHAGTAIARLTEEAPA